MIPAFSVTTQAATGYDRGYAGGFAGDGYIHTCGLDVSYWQGDTLDFNSIVASGYTYVILRCGYRTNSGIYKDTQFENYYAKAKAAGLNVGAYFYSKATNATMAYEEANATLNYISGKKFEYPIYFDYEDSTQIYLGSSTQLSIMRAYLSTIKNAGYLAGIYSGITVFNQSWFTSSEIPSTYEGWIAYYHSSGTYTPMTYQFCSKYGMYQFSGSWRISGYAYDLDANVCYKDYPSIVKQYGFNGYEVGKWEYDGNGWRYFDGTSYVSGWKVIDGETYYFGGNNYMYTGWLDYEGKRYIFNPSNGIMQRGWFEIDGAMYYMDSNGVMQTGWVQIEDQWYYFNADGSRATGWIMDGETTYCMDENGVMLTGWRSIDGEWQQFSPWGVYYHNTGIATSQAFIAKITTNADLNKALSLSNNNVQLRTDDGGKDQLWRFELQDDGSYKVTNLENGWCLDVQDANTCNGSNVQTWQDNGAAAQRWVITSDTEDGGYTLRPVNALNAGTVMDVINADTSDGSNIVLSAFHGGINQQFTLTMFGDSNNDNQLSISDVTFIQKILSGGANIADLDLTLGDVNGNGKIDIRDATYIQLFLSRVADSFPVCE